MMTSGGNMVVGSNVFGSTVTLTSTITLNNNTTGSGTLSISANATIEGTAAVMGPSVIIEAGTGSLTINNGVSLIGLTGANLSVGRTAVASNADPGSNIPPRPSNVGSGQVNVSGGGTLFWGGSNLTIANTTPQFFAAGQNLIFDANGSTISIGANTIVEAGQ
jgi:hypothetical protein